MIFDTKHLYAVIMAGGKGERFWPAGRLARPKQLLSLLSNQTMIEETVQRLFPLIAPERVLVITNTSYVAKIRELLPIPAENIIGEPIARDTAPCVALATALVMRRDPDATMIMLPADHVITPAKIFQDILRDSAIQAQNGVLVTLGIPPTYPSTGYGYIHAGDKVADGFKRVIEFKEKPDPLTAKTFLLDGNYLWNSGMFIWRGDTIYDAFRCHLPALAEKITLWSNGADYTKNFADCEKISIDYAIMEKAENVLVGETAFEWNDIGSWSALRDVLAQDSDGNVCRGNILNIDSKNNVLISDDNSLIGIIGMQNIAVVKSGNGILVCPLNQEQRVKELVNSMKEKYLEFI